MNKFPKYSILYSKTGLHILSNYNWTKDLIQTFPYISDRHKHQTLSIFHMHLFNTMSNLQTTCTYFIHSQELLSMYNYEFSEVVGNSTKKHNNQTPYYINPELGQSSIKSLKIQFISKKIFQLSVYKID